VLTLKRADPFLSEHAGIHIDLHWLVGLGLLLNRAASEHDPSLPSTRVQNWFEYLAAVSLRVPPLTSFPSVLFHAVDYKNIHAWEFPAKLSQQIVTQ
jgi:hypothetical protein